MTPLTITLSQTRCIALVPECHRYSGLPHRPAADVPHLVHGIDALLVKDDLQRAQFLLGRKAHIHRHIPFFPVPRSTALSSIEKAHQVDGIRWWVNAAQRRVGAEPRPLQASVAVSRTWSAAWSSRFRFSRRVSSRRSDSCMGAPPPQGRSPAPSPKSITS